MSFGKNSPQTSQQSSTTTKNTSISPTVSGNSAPVTVGPTISDVTGVHNISISTTDQGAVAAGLSIAKASLDTLNTETAASNALASQVAAGQSNTSLKYLVLAGVGIAAIIAAVFIFRKK